MKSGIRIYWIVMSAIIVAAYALVWRNAYAAKHALDVAMPQPRSGSSKVMVTYLFHPSDCPDATEVIDALDSLAATGHQINGLMVTSNADEKDISDVSRAYRIHFPVKAIGRRDAGLVLGALRYARTPLAIVRDSSGAIRLIIPGRAAAPTAAQMLSLARS